MWYIVKFIVASIKFVYVCPRFERHFSLTIMSTTGSINSTNIFQTNVVDFVMYVSLFQVLLKIYIQYHTVGARKKSKDRKSKVFTE